jgi:hypothetical protein
VQPLVFPPQQYSTPQSAPEPQAHPLGYASSAEITVGGDFSETARKAIDKILAERFTIEEDDIA